MRSYGGSGLRSFVMFVIDVIEENKLLCCAHVTTKVCSTFCCYGHSTNGSREQ